MSEGLTPLCAKVARFPIYRTKNDTGCTRRVEGEEEGVTSREESIILPPLTPDT